MTAGSFDDLRSFNPRPRMRANIVAATGSLPHVSFNPRPRMRANRQMVNLVLRHQMVSIHALV